MKPGIGQGYVERVMGIYVDSDIDDIRKISQEKNGKFTKL